MSLSSDIYSYISFFPMIQCNGRALSKKRHPPICLGPCTWIHYVALAYPTVPDHQQQQDYKRREPTESPPVSEMSRSYGRPSARNACRCSFVQRQISFLRLDRRPSQSGQRRLGKPAYDPQVARAIYEHGYGCKNQSVYAVHVRHHRRYPMLRTVLDVCAVLETR
jgi:hypothetical protein